jgi:hypothetical protein
MIWLYLTIAFIVGVLVGWSLCMNDANLRCPDKSLPDFEYINTETITEKDYSEPSSYELGGTYTYDVTVKKYSCKKCGYIKTVK